MQATTVTSEAERLIYAHFQNHRPDGATQLTALRLGAVELFVDALDATKIIFGVISLNGKKMALPRELLLKLSQLRAANRQTLQSPSFVRSF